MKDKKVTLAVVNTTAARAPMLRVEAQRTVTTRIAITAVNLIAH
jgi:hypothetical protein